jgi:hypothetical protein
MGILAYAVKVLDNHCIYDARYSRIRERSPSCWAISKTELVFRQCLNSGVSLEPVFRQISCTVRLSMNLTCTKLASCPYVRYSNKAHLTGDKKCM